MIIVQDKNKEVINLLTTLQGFANTYLDKPNGKYEYLRSKLAQSRGHTIKYKAFYLTKRPPVKGTKRKSRKNILKHNRFSIG